MKYFLILLIVLISAATFVYAAIAYANMYIDKNIYRLNYESMRNELESLYRTKGMGIDPAFSCKMKVSQNEH